MASNFIKEKFFVLDSNNYKDFKTKLYGYYFDEQGNLITQSNFEKFDENAHGAYVFIENNNNKITIKQDFNGSYGLYLFQKDNYFAVSNSFLYLVEYLKSKFELSYNYDYANHFLSAGLCSLSYSDTFCNEIKLISRNSNIIICDDAIKINESEFIDYKIPINSQEGINILDKWFYKWTSIIRNLKKNTNLIKIDLSGGFDSRCCLALFLASNINLDEIVINSADDSNRNHIQDFKIASEIAKYFKFKLNSSFGDELLNISPINDIKTAIDLSFYVKLDCQKIMHFKTGIFNKICFHFEGYGGECIHRSSMYSLDETFDSYKNFNKINARKSCGSGAEIGVERILQSTFNEVNKINSDKYYNFQYLYKGTIARYHFGKACVEEFLVNTITPSLLMDKELLRIDIKDNNYDFNLDRKLLITVLLDRYCPDLLKFELEGGRKFEPKTLEYAKKINAKFPFTNPYKTKISLQNQNNSALDFSYAKRDVGYNNDKITVTQCNNYLKDIFINNNFKNLFQKHFSKKAYSFIFKTLNNKHIYPPYKHIYSAIACIKFLLDIQQSKANKNNNSSLDDLQALINIPDHKFDDSELDLSEFDDNLRCRIDVKNIGTKDCSVEIHGIDAVYPEWFKNEKGVGSMINTYVGSREFECICKGNGYLHIYLKGIYKNKDKQRIPVYVCADELKLNDIPVLSESKIVWHDDSYLYKMPVTDGQKVKISVKFSPAFYKK